PAALSLRTAPVRPRCCPPVGLCRCCAHRALLAFPTRRSSDLRLSGVLDGPATFVGRDLEERALLGDLACLHGCIMPVTQPPRTGDRKSTRLNSSPVKISYAVLCL